MQSFYFLQKCQPQLEKILSDIILYNVETQSIYERKKHEYSRYRFRRQRTRTLLEVE